MLHDHKSFKRVSSILKAAAVDENWGDAKCRGREPQKEFFEQKNVHGLSFSRGKYRVECVGDHGTGIKSGRAGKQKKLPVGGGGDMNSIIAAPIKKKKSRLPRYVQESVLLN